MTTIEPMPEAAFWTIIDASVEYAADAERQEDALRAELRKLSPEELGAFELAFQRELNRSYSWDLWGADYVVHGGASDDGFEYFQRWLISKGRKVFSAVLADPDCLADILAEEPGGPLEFEEFAYVAGDVWSEKTGMAIDDPASSYPIGAASFPAQPSGVEFDETEAHLAARYPKLWARFGASPLV
jgi:hypothetical protein